MRHVSAEKSIFSSGEQKGASEQPVPSGNGKSKESDGERSARSQKGQGAKRGSPPSDVDSHLKPFQKASGDSGRVTATTSDEVAEKMWGTQQKTDPEFFI